MEPDVVPDSLEGLEEPKTHDIVEHDLHPCVGSSEDDGQGKSPANLPRNEYQKVADCVH